MKQFNRPLSPHLSTYKPQITSIISIFHRITGSLLGLVFLSIGTLYSLFSSFISFNIIYLLYYLLSFIGVFLWYFLIISVFFHALNGIRHISWDFGLGLDLNSLTTTGILVVSIAFALFLTIIIL